MNALASTDMNALYKNELSNRTIYISEIGNIFHKEKNYIPKKCIDSSIESDLHKWRKQSYFRKSIIIIIILMYFGLKNGFAETDLTPNTFLVDSNISSKTESLYVQGEFYLKIKDNIEIFWDQKGRDQNLEIFEFLKPLIERYNIYDIQCSFFFANNPRLKRTLRLKFQNIEATNELLKILNNISEIEYAEKMPANYTCVIPNDPSYSNQWYLSHINAPQAWDISKGSSTIKIAIVDNAIETNHPDLSANLVAGFDVSDWDSDPNPPNSTFYHGTHVAGIASAKTNNGTGISGIGWNCKIIPIKAEYNNGNAVNISHGYEGITWASQNGADIINNSWGSLASSNTGQLVINDAWNAGCIIVAAAGNDNTNSPAYPAAYNNVFAVANSTSSDLRNSSSNYGSWVDITAPGTSIYSTSPFGTYSNLSGTSMSSPLVAGLLGLVWSVDLNASKSAVINCIKNTASPLSWTGGGAGLINAGAALLSMSGGSQPPTNDNCSGSIILNINTSCSFISGSVNNATDDGFPTLPTCNGGSATQNGVFYKAVLVSNNITIKVNPNLLTNSGLDAVVVVYTGSSCNNLTEIGCADPTGVANVSLTLTGLTPGASIWIRIYDWGAIMPIDGGFEICLTNTNSGGSTPIANFSGTPKDVYIGESVTFTDNSTNSPTSWSWSFQGGTPTSSNSQNPIVEYPQPGIYDVTLTATNSNGSSTKIRNSYISVTVDPSFCVFTLNKTELYLSNEGGTVQFDITTQNTCSWSTTSENWIHISQTNGIGSSLGNIAIVDENISSTQRIGSILVEDKSISIYQNGFNSTSTNFISDDEKIIVYPNPNKSNSAIYIKSEIDFHKIQLWNSLGILVKEYTNSKKLDLPKEIINGLYYLKMQDGNGIYYYKKIKIMN